MSGIIFQIISTIIICYACMGLGITMGWPSSTLLLFNSPNTTLHRPITGTEASLLGSLSSIGPLISNPLAAIFLDRIGRKYCCIAATFMGLVGWIMIVSSNLVEVVLAANLVFGLGGSIFLVAPVYIAEICQESIRGTMTSLVIMFYGMGMLISNLLGGCLSYHTMNYVFLSIAASSVTLLFILKKSPTFLMQKGREEEAKKSIAFYKAVKVYSKEVVEEVDKIKRALRPDMEETTTQEEEKLNPEKVAPEPYQKLSFIQFLKKSRSTRRALLLLFILMTASIFEGLIVVMIYAKPLFDKIVPKEVMSSNLCSVLLCAVNVVSSMLAGYLTDKAGRRVLMIMSSILTCICCVIVGCLITFEWGPQWLIAVFIYLYTAVVTVGAGTVPFILVAEILLPEVRGYISMIVLEWAWICNFSVLYIFQPAVAAFGIGPVFFIFAIISILSGIYSYFFLPETKGLSVDLIQLKLLKRGNL